MHFAKCTHANLIPVYFRLRPTVILFEMHFNYLSVIYIYPDKLSVRFIDPIILSVVGVY